MSVWASLCNVDVGNPRSTKEFLFLSIKNSGQWFHLARYFDFDFAGSGPDALAHFLGLPVEDVFPISYSINRYVTGDSPALSGTIEKEPRERLTQVERIKLTLG
jgi:hypothetical protein